MVTSTLYVSGSYSQYPGLNKDGGIRLYSYDPDQSITFTLKEGTIAGVRITYKEGFSEGLVFTVNGSVIEPVDGDYFVYDSSFTIANGKESGQVRIDSIEILIIE
jgi:hypothetical protein